MTKKISVLILFVLTILQIGFTQTPTSCSGFKTFTQGGWASTPNGNNPGTILNNGFTTVFPNGITIGCTNKLKLTSAAAVRAFLPSGSSARALPLGTLTNPTRSTYSNVLAGQLVALTINLKFDSVYSTFAPNTINLKNLVVISGPFIGKTVQQVYDIANQRIGGCSTQYTFSDINTAIDKINRNYDNGTTNGGFLVCPLKTTCSTTDVSCFGGSDGSMTVFTTGGLAPYQYQWTSNTGNTPVSNNLAAGTYTVTVTDAVGQISKSICTVNQPTELLITVGKTDVKCFGDSSGSMNIQIQGGTPSYLINFNSQGFVSQLNSWTNLSSNTYTWVVKDSKGCEKSGFEIISQPEKLVISITYTSPTCNTNSGTATISFVGGVSPYSVIFTNLTPTSNETTVQTNPKDAPLSTESSGIEIELNNTENTNQSPTIYYSSPLIQNQITQGTYMWQVTDANGCTSGFKIDTVTCVNPVCLPLKTYSIGGWGTTPNGTNPGSYLHNNFSSAFPNGITLGCTNKIEFTSAQSITNWLPSGTNTYLLPTGTLTNPTSTQFRSNLVSQLLGVTLSVGFDSYDVNFGSGTQSLGGMYYVGQPFDGKTVNFIINEANNLIGGCGSIYTSTQLQTALSNINLNYDDGTTNINYLTCTSTSNRVMKNNLQPVSNDYIYPNPTSTYLNLQINGSVGEKIIIEFFDMLGKLLKTKSVVLSNKIQTIQIPVLDLNCNNCIVKINNGTKVTTHKVILIK